MKALIFDQDGVIADTERDGHRVAFNRVFEEEALGVCWSVQRYGELLKIAGGKERMKTVVYSDEFTKAVGDKEAYIKKLHKRKTDVFMEIVSQGQIALRSGIGRLVREAHQDGLKLAVCSTSNERAVHTLVKTLLGEEAYGWFDVILAGDVVTDGNSSNGNGNGNGKVGAVAVVGAGIAGMQAALDLAETGYKVYLVERSSSIGGRMAQLDKTFPTNDCAM